MPIPGLIAGPLKSKVTNFVFIPEPLGGIFPNREKAFDVGVDVLMHNLSEHSSITVRYTFQTETLHDAALILLGKLCGPFQHA